MKKKPVKIVLLTSITLIILFFIFIVTVIGNTYEQYVGLFSSYESSQGGFDEFGGMQSGVIKGKRTSYPSSDNPFFFSSKYNPFVGTPYGPPALTHNCTWYAYGRFAEIMGKKPVGLPTGNASQWYSSCTAFERGRTPKLGAVVCWSYTDDPFGHVAIVEEIKPNGDIVTSNSGWRGGKFWMQTWTKASGYQGGHMVLQGFIYQPKEPDFTPTGPVVSPGTSNSMGDRIANTAISLAWPAGTSSAKYSYSSGTSTSAFKSAIDRAYPNRTHWSSAPKKGASCDVFVGTVVRTSSGYDKNYPRGFEEQLPHVQNSSKWKRVSGFDTSNRSVSKLKNGDIILYTRSNGHVHTLIYYNINGSEGRVEAQFSKTYGHVVAGRSSLQKKINANNINRLYAYRAG